MKISGSAVCGAIALGLGVFGVYNAVLSFGQPQVDRRDVTTKGVVTRIHGTAISHRLTGVDLNRQFNFDYQFKAEDGKSYTGSSIIDEATFRSLREGQDITVRYHSHNPIVNASIPYGVYTSVGVMPKSTPLFRLCFSLGFCVIGVLLISLNFTGTDESQSAGLDGIPQLRTA